MRDAEHREVWKPVPLFEDRYLVSNMGRVKSIGKYNTCKRDILSPMTDPSGYYHVVLYKDNTRKDISIHRLVAICFVPNPNGYKYVNHIDEDRKNNVSTNLEWCTNSYNLTYSRGIAVCQYNKSGELIATYDSIMDASRTTNIPTSNISKCCNGARKSAGGYLWRYHSVAKLLKQKRYVR